MTLLHVQICFSSHFGYYNKIKVLISLTSVVNCCPMGMISPSMKLFQVKTSNITIFIHANMKFCRNEVLFSDSPYLQVGYKHVVWSRYFSESSTI